MIFRNNPRVWKIIKDGGGGGGGLERYIVNGVLAVSPYQYPFIVHTKYKIIPMNV